MKLPVIPSDTLNELNEILRIKDEEVLTRRLSIEALTKADDMLGKLAILESKICKLTTGKNLPTKRFVVKGRLITVTETSISIQHLDGAE